MMPGAAGQVKIVALTANAVSEVREKCLEAGMTGCLTKPIRLDDLAKALRSFQEDADKMARTESLSEPAGQELVHR